ncbi:MAG: TerB family tellurite resistance protein [Flavobacteriales bacterium]|nr:TerB family tellurite resistance protein [Flavobacteriales bacterium]
MIKFIAALLGYYLMRFPGAILGYLIGSFIESSNISVETNRQFRSSGGTQRDFSRSFLVLTAAVLKADGTVTRNELDFVKELYKQNFGVEKTREDMLLLRDILNGEILWEQACSSINQFMIKTERVKLVHYLFGIAKADGNITQHELNIIRNIALRINLTQYDFEIIRSRFTGTYSGDFWEQFNGSSGGRTTGSYSVEVHYSTLELTSSATDEEIKSKYRKLAREYHPDKHASKSEEEARAAEEKFKKIQLAYNEIKKARGM